MKYDIIIIGGGLVGTSLANAICHLPLKIALIEAKSFEAKVADPRPLVLSHVSVNIFTALGFWQHVAKFANPIAEVHVSHQGKFGQARFKATEHKVQAFGYLIKAEKLLNSLREEILAKKIDVISPATITAINNNELTLKKGGETINCQAKLIIAADGANSTLRQLENIAVETYDYEQTAVIATVKLERAHHNIAYERFTHNGHIAMLPLNEAEYASIWAVKNNKLEQLQNISDQEYLQQLQENFGYRLGRFATVNNRIYYPLKLTFAKEQIKKFVVLIGNAAHSLHPLAAQGFNLGLRDVAVLAELLSDATVKNKSINSDEILEEYVAWRKQDHKHIKRFTDSNVKLFASHFLPIVMARDLGLVVVDLLPGLKQKIVKLGMGMNGKMPKLAVGIPLNE